MNSVASEMASGGVPTSLDLRERALDMYERDAGFEVPALVKHMM